MNQASLALFQSGAIAAARSQSRSTARWSLCPVLVQLPNGSSITIEADVNDTLDTLKAQIQNMLGYDMTYYRLMKPLEGNRTIEEYQIQHSQIFLVKPGWQIFVTFADKQLESRIVLDVDAYDTIDEIKAKIHESSGIPPTVQRLTFAGQQLESGTLAENGIHNQCLLFL